MQRALALLLLISGTAFAAGKSSDPEPGSFDVEPPMLIPNRDREKNVDAVTPPSREVDLAKLENEFERAKRNIAGLDRLLKIGALSKLEVEQRRLRVVHLEFELANARLVTAKEQMLEKEKQVNAGEIAKADVTPAANDLALAIQAAHAAHTKSDQADIDAAEANVHRREKLLALGSARKKDVDRALQKLADLRAQEH